jgi:hypothetical protein
MQCLTIFHFINTVNTELDMRDCPKVMLSYAGFPQIYQDSLEHHGTFSAQGFLRSQAEDERDI